MYHALVKRIALRNFTRVNDHDHAPLLASCTTDIHHRFSGSHPLGGERHDREALGHWFERLGRLFPDLHLDVHDIWVKGWPHHTTVIIRWTSTATLTDGTPYTNHGVHIVTMRWGRATAIDANEDSQAVADAMTHLAAAGIPDATAEPILS